MVGGFIGFFDAVKALLKEEGSISDETKIARFLEGLGGKDAAQFLHSSGCEW